MNKPNARPAEAQHTGPDPMFIGLTREQIAAVQPGPCVVCGDTNYPLSCGGSMICPVCDTGASSDPKRYRALRLERDQLRIELKLLREANAGLLSATQTAYAILADVRHEWPGRSTSDGQFALIAMRDAICKATGRDAQDVQDEYTNAHLNRAALAQSRATGGD